MKIELRASADELSVEFSQLYVVSIVPSVYGPFDLENVIKEASIFLRNGKEPPASDQCPGLH